MILSSAVHEYIGTVCHFVYEILTEVIFVIVIMAFPVCMAASSVVGSSD